MRLIEYFPHLLSPRNSIRGEKMKQKKMCTEQRGLHALQDEKSSRRGHTITAAVLCGHATFLSLYCASTSLHFFYIPLPFFSFLESEAATKQYSCYYPGSSVFLKNIEDDGGQHILCEYFCHHPCSQRVRAASAPVFFYWQCDQKKLHANKSKVGVRQNRYLPHMRTGSFLAYWHISFYQRSPKKRK